MRKVKNICLQQTSLVYILNRYILSFISNTSLCSEKNVELKFQTKYGDNFLQIITVPNSKESENSKCTKILLYLIRVCVLKNNLIANNFHNIVCSMNTVHVIRIIVYK